MVKWLILAVAVAGVVYAMRYSWKCWLCWLATNACWAIHNYRIGEIEQAIQYSIFIGLCFFAFYRWRTDSAQRGDVRYWRNKARAAQITIGILQEANDRLRRRLQEFNL